MLKDGVLTLGGIDVDAVYGIHLWSGLKVGECICMPGPIMAGGDFFYITIKGVGCVVVCALVPSRQPNKAMELEGMGQRHIKP